MFKRAVQQQFRRLHTQASAATPRSRRFVYTAGTTIALGSALWYSDTHKIYNDVPNDLTPSKDPVELAINFTRKIVNLNTLFSVVWGSNSNEVILPGGQTKEVIRIPTIAPWLEGVALRDLRFHKRHAACIDAKGDVYQWGEGFFGTLASGMHAPKLTLQGKNIQQLQLTEHKIYALSASGKVYTLSSNIVQQKLDMGKPTPASDSWWGTGWFWGEEERVDFIELQPSEKMAWGESFVSIAGGDNHLLALTSKGRVFAHPVNKQANQYGQLGFRQFDIPDPESAITKRNSHLHVDLVPKALTDPFANASRSVRATSNVDSDLSKIDDTSIRFCPTIYEIPVLKGVDCDRVAAGSRTSFLKTKAGRVLAWGANEYGQLGLGSSVALNTITVPTEVVLWRLAPKNAETRCSDIVAGGDLTAFVVERQIKGGPTTVELLMSGNGQHGGLGNKIYTTSQGDPLRVKAVSGLEQFNDRIKALEPILPEEIVISPTGHVLMALNSCTDSGDVGGRDLMVWGRNYDSELGNGKRGSVSVPCTLDVDGDRFMLMSRKAKEVRDLHGNVWKKNVKVKQHAVAGYGNSGVYWKIA